MNHRPINVIAADIEADWTKISPYAKPYLEAMFCVQKPTDRYIMDDGRTVVLYFLSNAMTWRGETARKIKKELKAIVGLR